ncbi:hypothetical protein GSS87_04010 [Corynebacterium sp. 4HC-13]|uniref:Rv1476 family membrane protein n=1 Tax=Corynebacterium anserum TaxID=2684406 RepID=UPI00163B2870|nr:DUF6676 family protein [Corynebacterium anserum]MBC2681566.1 hypothetical protein [Corynebacterium anserum]
MLPQNINVDDIASHLHHSDLYLSPEVVKIYGEETTSIQEHYDNILNGTTAPHISEDLGATKIVVYPSVMRMDETRDLAQALKSKVDANTIIVQAEGIPGIISDKLTRGQIQDTQYLMVNSFHPAEVETFINTVHGTDLNYGTVNAIVLTLTALAAIFSVAFTRFFGGQNRT